MTSASPHFTTSMPSTRLLVLTVLSALLAAPLASAFNFTTPIDQCANVSLSWTGGQAPYEILLVPIGHLDPEIRTIINYQNIQSTSFSFPLTFPSGSKFVATLSDSKYGAGSGGTSQVLTVGSSQDSSCLATQQVKPEFYFFLNSTTPTECEPFEISWPNPASDSGATDGFGIWAVVPGGPTFQVPIPSQPESDHALNELCSDWIVDVPSNTSILLVAGNAESNGRGKGGSTDLLTVAKGTDSTCLSTDPAATTQFGSVPTGATSGSAPSSTSSPKNGGQSTNNNTGAAFASASAKPSLLIAFSVLSIAAPLLFLS